MISFNLFSTYIDRDFSRQGFTTYLRYGMVNNTGRFIYLSKYLVVCLGRYTSKRLESSSCLCLCVYLVSVFFNSVLYFTLSLTALPFLVLNLRGHGIAFPRTFSDS